MKFAFKSTGRDIVSVLSDSAELTIAKSAIPIGIMTPLRRSQTGQGIFEMYYDVTSQVADNLRNLVQTNHGERLGRPSFGANLRPLSMEIMGQEKFESEAMSRISRSVSKYLPFINLKTMSVSSHRDTEFGLPQAVIRLEYDVKRLGKKKILDVVITLAG